MSGTALLSLGSNVEPQSNLASAARVLRGRFPGVKFSPVYRVPAVGFDGPDFLNAGALISSDLEPIELDAWLHALEDAHGRRRDVPRFSSRTLDIDLVLFDDRVMKGPGHLQLPRPELRHAFVLKPLADLAPEFLDSVSGRTLRAMWEGRAEPMEQVAPTL